MLFGPKLRPLAVSVVALAFAACGGTERIPGELSAGPRPGPEAEAEPTAEEPRAVSSSVAEIRPAMAAENLPNVNASQSSGHQAEVSIAVDRFNPDRLIAASMGGSSGRILVMHSNDAGATWQQILLPRSSGAGHHADPMVDFDSRGVAHLANIPVSGGPQGIDVHRSTDGGATWSPAIRISENAGRDDKLILVADDSLESPYLDRVYVAWKWPGGNIFLSRSFDGGVSWEEPRRIEFLNVSGLDMTLAADGTVYLAVTNGSEKKMKVMRSTDGGESFEAPVTVADLRGRWYTFTPSICNRHALIHASIGVDRSEGPHRGNVYLTWSDHAPGSPSSCSNACASETACTADVYVSRSADGGLGWSEPRTVHESGLGSSDQYHQWLEVDPVDGAVYVAYKDTRDDETRRATHVYLNRSTDGGATWSASLRVSTAESISDNGFQYGDYQSLTAFDGRVWAAWADHRESRGAGEIYVSRTLFEAEEPCPVEYGDVHYCRRCGPCADGEGGCRKNKHCQEGLVCVPKVGADYGLPRNRGVCLAECPWPFGHRLHCRKCGPCAEEEGGCTLDKHCEQGLECVDGVGPEFGFPRNSGVCLGT